MERDFRPSGDGLLDLEEDAGSVEEVDGTVAGDEVEDEEEGSARSVVANLGFSGFVNGASSI